MLNKNFDSNNLNDHLKKNRRKITDIDSINFCNEHHSDYQCKENISDLISNFKSGRLIQELKSYNPKFKRKYDQIQDHDFKRKDKQSLRILNPEEQVKLQKEKDLKAYEQTRLNKILKAQKTRGGTFAFDENSKLSETQLLSKGNTMVMDDNYSKYSMRGLNKDFSNTDKNILKLNKHQTDKNRSEAKFHKHWRTCLTGAEKKAKLDNENLSNVNDPYNDNAQNKFKPQNINKHPSLRKANTIKTDNAQIKNMIKLESRITYKLDRPRPLSVQPQKKREEINRRRVFILSNKNCPNNGQSNAKNDIKLFRDITQKVKLKNEDQTNELELAKKKLLEEEKMEAKFTKFSNKLFRRATYSAVSGLVQQKPKTEEQEYGEDLFAMSEAEEHKLGDHLSLLNRQLEDMQFSISMHAKSRLEMQKQDIELLLYLKSKTRSVEMADIDSLYNNMLGANDRMDNGCTLIYNDWSFFKEISSKFNNLPLIITLITFKNMRITRVEGHLKDYFMHFSDNKDIKLFSVTELLRLACFGEDNLVYVSLSIKDGNKELTWGQKFINLGTMIR